MYQLKRLSPESLPAALLKAERYRLLNQPWAAESICHDILAVDPDSQPAIVLLLLCMTDGCAGRGGIGRTRLARTGLARPARCRRTGRDPDPLGPGAGRYGSGWVGRR
jgi:hypothetical protein